MFDDTQEEQKTTVIAPRNRVPYNFSGRGQYMRNNSEPKDIFDEVGNDLNKNIEKDYSNQLPNLELTSKLGDNKNHIYEKEEIEASSYKKRSKIKTLSIIIIVFLSAVGCAWLAYIYFIKNFDSGNLIKKENVYNAETVNNTNNSSARIDNNQDLNKDNHTSLMPPVEIIKPIDTDQDGLIDDDEIKFGTDPKLMDTDSDGLTDMEEVIKYKTNPRNNDSDGDSYKDGEEIKNGYNPNGAGKLIDRVELP